MELNKLTIHNDFYQVRFMEKLKEKEIDIVLGILANLKYSDHLTLTYQQIKELCTRGKVELRNRDLVPYLDRLSNLLTSIKIGKAGDKLHELHVVFTSCYVNKVAQAFVIKVNSELLTRLFTDFQGNYTIINLVEIQTLQSKYSKLLYYILSQHRNKEESRRIIKYSIEEFKAMLGIPANYRMDNIDNRVIKPVMEQLKPYFPSINIEKIKRGVSVTDIQITWKNKTKSKALIESSEKGSQSGALQEINALPVKTKSTLKADKVINTVLQDKENSVSKEELFNIELTLEEVATAEYLLEQVDKLDLKIFRKLSSYKSMLRTRLNQEQELKNKKEY